MGVCGAKLVAEADFQVHFSMVPPKPSKDYEKSFKNVKNGCHKRFLQHIPVFSLVFNGDAENRNQSNSTTSLCLPVEAKEFFFCIFIVMCECYLLVPTAIETFQNSGMYMV